MLDETILLTRMNNALQITLTIVVAIALLIAFNTFFRSRQAKREAELQAYGERFKHRQVQPDFAAFTERYGCEVPPELRLLVSDSAWMRESEFNVQLPSSPDPYYVAWFDPMDDEHMSVIWPGTEGFYPFANDGCGNSYLVNPRNSHLEVSFYDHEAGERELLSASLSEFLTAKRTADESDCNG